MAETLYIGTGRRKTAVARVRILPGDGKIIVNGRDVDEYFPRPAYRTAVRSPLELLGSAGRYEVVAKIEGGGPTGQAEALRHGIARALAEESQEARSELKAAGMLTRDSRAVERKKYGLKKSRKSGSSCRAPFARREGPVLRPYREEEPVRVRTSTSSTLPSRPKRSAILPYTGAAGASGSTRAW